MKCETDEEWAAFGRRIYDTAINHFKDKPIRELVIPIEMWGHEVLKVSVTDVRHFWEPTGPIGDRYSSSRKGYMLSTGEIEWENK